MRKLARVLLATTLIVSLVGCIVAPVVPPIGGVFTDIKAPLDVDFNQNAAPSKSGKAMMTSILGAVSWGDCSIKAAAENGGLTTLDSADYQYFNVLGVYQTFTTVVHGK